MPARWQGLRGILRTPQTKAAARAAPGLDFRDW